MARRRKKSHRRSRHRRVGAINVKSVAMKAVSVAAGAFVGRTLQNMAAKSFPSVSPKMVGLGTIVVGALIPKFIKSDMGQGLGDGVLAVGAISTLQTFGVISGLGAVPGNRIPSRVLGKANYNPNAKAVGSYNAGARAVGAHPYNRQVVGFMPAAERELMMGALYYDE